jgi:Type IX secretion system protein PorV
MKKITWLGVSAFLMFQQIGTAQCYETLNKDYVDQNGQPCPKTVVAAVPFLRITPDARSGAMGDVGIAISPDANAMHLNTSKLVFADEKSGVSATYTPWLRALGLDDIYMAYLAGYTKINNRQVVGASARFFSLGDITFTDDTGNVTGTGFPNELEINVGFAQKLGENLSAAINGKYIYSNLASGQTVAGGTEPVRSGRAGAADISLTYNKPIRTANGVNNFRAALAIQNIGSKITYTQSRNRDYIPANLGIGAAYEMNINEYNSITFAVDLNKLAVPTPVARFIEDENGGSPIPNPDWDKDGDGIADWRQKGPVSSFGSSFTDASFKEELREWTYGLGVEYWYDKQFSVRAGYFNENKLKGGRKYLTLGMGLKYNVFGLNFSYLVPTTAQRNPLDNTLRFSLLFDFGALSREDAE